jgi:hypothetical protein
MLTLVKEDGSGLAGANSYASAADGDVYHDGHVYASDWTAATTAAKESALVMATRLIDAAYQFNGFRTSTVQALQWPRQRCLDPDRGVLNVDILANNRGDFFDSDAVPSAVVNAVCELARELIKADSSDAADGEGISQLSITGALYVQFDKKDKQPVISPTAQLFLAKLGSYLAGPRSAAAALTRV